MAGNPPGSLGLTGTFARIIDGTPQERRSSLKSISPQDSIIMMDSSGDVVFWNRASEIMFGWTVGEALGRKLHELIVPDMMKASC